MNTLGEQLESVLGIRLQDEAVLTRALTHPSWSHEHTGDPHYQRLEFLGDAVLELCATQLLMRRYPDEAEGLLTTLRQKIVDRPTLAEVGIELGLGTYVRLGVSEAAKPQVEARILADITEAVVGAMFLEAGLDACQALVDRWFGPRVDALRALVEAGAAKPATNRLQELTQSMGGTPPTYRFRADGPDHDRTFHATVLVDDDELATATGPTKKAAKKAVARLALAILARRRGLEAS